MAVVTSRTATTKNHVYAVESPSSCGRRRVAVPIVAYTRRTRRRDRWTAAPLAYLTIQRQANECLSHAERQRYRISR